MIAAWRVGSPVIRGTFLKVEGSPSLGALSSTKGHAAVLVVSGLCFGAAALLVFARPTTAQVLASASLNDARAGHTATTLEDGTILIVGGKNHTGVLESAEIFDPAAGISVSTGSMLARRVDHTATLLSDGRVLVTGGRHGRTLLQSTEIYDPATRSFMPGPGMTRARSGHNATLLRDGRVLIVGGESRGTADIFDPTQWRFVSQGQLHESRWFAGAALLSDGSVLVAGGSDATGHPMRSAEIYFPSRQGFALDPHLMQVPRDRPLLRVLPDANVLTIGGNLDGSMELFDAEKREFRGWAKVLNESNGLSDILRARTRSGLIHPIDPRDVLLQSQLTPDARELLDRTAFALAEVPGSNQAVVTGGVNSVGRFLRSALVLGSSDATITTDQSDYPPGSTVEIAGTGWQAGEPVEITIHEEPSAYADVISSVVASRRGDFVDTSFMTSASDDGRTFTVTAVGQSSSRVAQTVFTDAFPCSTTSNGCFPFRSDYSVNIQGASSTRTLAPSRNSYGTTPSVEHFSLNTSGSSISWDVYSTPLTGTFTLNSPYSATLWVHNHGAAQIALRLQVALFDYDPARGTETPIVPAGSSGSNTKVKANTDGQLKTNQSAPYSYTIPAAHMLKARITITQGSPTSVTAQIQYNGPRGGAADSGLEFSSVQNLPFGPSAARTTASISSASPDPSVVGQPYSVALRVTPVIANGTMGGVVTVSDGLDSCIAPVTGSGGAVTASCTLRSATVGSPKTLVALYSGDAHYASAVSAGAPHTVNRASTATAIAATPNPSSPGQSIGLSATVTVVSPGSGTATGAVTFMDGASVLGTASLNASARAIFSTAALTSGVHSISAVYEGHSNYNGSASGVVHQTINKADQSITVIAPAPAVGTYGTSFTVTASASAALPVTITTSGGCSGAGTDSASVAMTSGGTACIVHYNQGGDSSYNAAPEVTSSTTANKALPIIDWSNPADITVGTALGVAQLGATATFNSALVSGSFTYTPAPATFLSVGNAQTLHVEFTPTNGFDFDVAVRDVTINVLPVGTSVTITDPIAGATVSVGSLLVQGIVEAGGAEVSLSVNGVQASVQGSTFTATVLVGPGTTTLTATATTLAGHPISHSIAVKSVSSTSGGIELVAMPSSGVAPLTVSFALRGAPSASTVELDFDGDGEVDSSGPSLIGQHFTYTQTGVYFPVATLTDGQGGQTSVTGTVLVQSPSVATTWFQTLWNSFKARLVAGDVTGALTYLSPAIQPDFDELFRSLGPDLPAIASSLESLSVVEQLDDLAEAAVVRQEDDTPFLYFVYFRRDNLGSWLIEEM